MSREETLAEQQASGVPVDEGMSEDDLKQLGLLAAEGMRLASEEEEAFPKPPSKDSTLAFYRDIIGRKDSTKTGNLKEHELGSLKLPVRKYIDLAKFSRAVELGVVGDYFQGKAETVLASSLSKQGFLLSLFVTQIKKEVKDTGSSSEEVSKQKTRRWGW